MEESTHSSHDSLLRLATNHFPEDDGWDDVLEWFDNTPVTEAQLAASETNEFGETALHILLKNVTQSARYTDGGTHKSSSHGCGEGMAVSSRGGEIDLVRVVNKFVEIDCDAFEVQDCRGYTPLHIACHDRACSFEVIRALIEAYPPALGMMSNSQKKTLTHSPFGWDYDVSPGGHFTDFIQDAVASDVCSSGVKNSTTRKRKNRHRILGHCKNYVPLDILKKGMLNERTLESTAMIRWLNEMPCKRSVVCSMVFELYLHILWITLFIRTTWLHLEEDQSLRGWEPMALLVFAAMFLVQELYQLYRFVKTRATIAYWLDFWNWIDLTTVGLVAASAIKVFLGDDKSVHAERILMTAGFFQFLLLVSYLKKTFFPFSKFVSGVIKIFWSLVPFLVISFITIFAFSFMYYVKERDSDPQLDDEPGNKFASLLDGFRAVYESFVPDSPGSDDVLDYLVGISIIMVLLNVVIAVVSEAWEDAVEEADHAFWRYRFELILEKTRGIDEDRFRTVLCGCFGDLDEELINIETVGTTTEELSAKMALAYRENGSFSCVLIILKALFWVILGFFTFGALWPKFFRQILFTPPKPKKCGTNLQLDQMAEGIAKCEQEILSYKNEVAKLTSTVNVNIELMQRLLSTNEDDSKKNE